MNEARIFPAALYFRPVVTLLGRGEGMVGYARDERPNSRDAFGNLRKCSFLGEILLMSVFNCMWELSDCLKRKGTCPYRKLY